VRRWDAE